MPTAFDDLDFVSLQRASNQNAGRRETSVVNSIGAIGRGKNKMVRSGLANVNKPPHIFCCIAAQPHTVLCQNMARDKTGTKIISGLAQDKNETVQPVFLSVEHCFFFVPSLTWAESTPPVPLGYPKPRRP